MAEETVVKEPLTDQMIASGREVVKKLHEENFATVSAFWLFTSEARQWYFMIASPIVEAEGTRKAYGRVQKVLAKMPSGNGTISLFDVKVVPSDYPLIKPLRKLVRSAVRHGNGTADVRLTRNVIDNTYIEDAYVYREAA